MQKTQKALQVEIAAMLASCLKANYREEVRLSKRAHEIWFSYLAEKDLSRATRLLQEWSKVTSSLSSVRNNGLMYAKIMIGDLSANQW